MMIIMMLILIFILLMIFLLMMMLILSMKKFKYREKLMSFECGFDPISSMRKPFSIRFYLLTILFLIFDVEIVIIIPIIYFNLSLINIIMMNFILILLILLIGIFIEWKEGALNWMK